MTAHEILSVCATHPVQVIITIAVMGFFGAAAWRE